MGKCRVKEQLNSQFALKDLGEAKSLLGIRIRRENDKICLDQKNYIIETLYKFNIFDCKPANIPYAVETRQRANASDDRLYQEPLGCLNYISLCTRPDIAYTVNYLSKFNNGHNEKYWK